MIKVIKKTNKNTNCLNIVKQLDTSFEGKYVLCRTLRIYLHAY